MTEAEFGAHRRLEQLQDTLTQQIGSCGHALLDFAHVPISPALLADVETCLRSHDARLIGTGLHTLRGLLLERPIDALPQEFRRLLVWRIEQLLQHECESVARQAMDWYAELRTVYTHYRERMIGYLRHESAWRRKCALRYYDTYTTAGEIDLLLSFRRDDSTTESHADRNWRYDLRNRAFGWIEEQLARRFERIVLCEPYRGASVQWYDWSPFDEWRGESLPTRERKRRAAT